MPFTRNDYDAAMRDVFYLRNEVNNLINQLRNQTGEGFNFIMGAVDDMLGSFQKLGEVQTLSYTENKNTMTSDGTSRTVHPACSIPSKATFMFFVNVTFHLYLPTVDGIKVQANASITQTSPADVITGAYEAKAVADTPKYVSGDTPNYIYVTVPLCGYYYNSSGSDLSSIPVTGILTKYVGQSLTSNVSGQMAISGFGAVLL